MKKDKVFILMIIIITLATICSSLIAMNNYNEHQKQLIIFHKELVESCKNLDRDELDETSLETCERYIASDLSEYNLNTYEGYYRIIDQNSPFFLELILPLIIICGSAYYITKFLRNRLILNENNRHSYKKTIKELFLSGWKYSIIIPLMFVSMFFILLIYIGPNGFKLGLTDFIGTIFENNLLLYFIFLLIQSFVLSLLYINIALIVSRKEHKYILTIIKSFMIVIGIELFIEIFNNNIMYGLLEKSRGFSFNIISIFDVYEIEDIYYNMFCTLVAVVVSFVVLFLCYKNKEKLIVDSEKNDSKENE